MAKQKPPRIRSQFFHQHQFIARNKKKAIVADQTRVLFCEFNGRMLLFSATHKPLISSYVEMLNESGRQISIS